MRIYDNGIYRDMTADELAAFEAQSILDTIAERSRPMTQEEVSRLLIAQQINTLSVDDNTALRMKGFYPEWKPDTDYAAGFKVSLGGRLWRVVQAHTSQTGWEPENAPSLWEQLSETHEGTMADPVPYEGNMALEAGKHYIQDRVIYLCDRDTVNPVYQPLSDLLGLYVTIV